MSIPWAKIIPIVQAYAPKVWAWWQRRKARKELKAIKAEEARIRKMTEIDW